MWRAAVIFIAIYLGLIFCKRWRPQIAWFGIIAALLVGALRPAEILSGVNWNVMGIFIGSLILAELFIYSKVPETISDRLINHSPNLGIAFLYIIGFASVLSIFIENVVTVLIVAPIALELSRKANVSPVPVIIGLAVSSNLQGVAILIGDTPSMILAARMKMNFLDFFIYNGKTGIFFLVQAGAVAGLAVLYFFLGRNRHQSETVPVTKVRSWLPVWMIVISILLLSVASCVDSDFKWFGGTVCMAIGLFGLLWYVVKVESSSRDLLMNLDRGTAAFLAAVFILVAMLENRGAVDALVARLDVLAGLNTFVIYTVVVWFSVLVSAFIDNIPYVTAMLPVVIGFSEKLGLPGEFLVFGVLIGSCLGGNITPIGASANLVSVGILEKVGHHVSFLDFVRIGFPFTVAATGVSYALLWLIYHP